MRNVEVFCALANHRSDKHLCMRLIYTAEYNNLKIRSISDVISNKDTVCQNRQVMLGLRQTSASKAQQLPFSIISVSPSETSSAARTAMRRFSS